MPHTFTAADRRSLIKLASTLPAGSVERRVLLAEVSADALAEGFGLEGLTEEQRLKIEERNKKTTGRKWNPREDADLIRRALKGDISEDERELLLYSPYYFNLARPGQRVGAHLNLGDKFKYHGLRSFVLKGKGLSGKTIGHVPRGLILDAKFNVQASGQKKVERAGEGGGGKTVHAGAIGRWGGERASKKGIRIKYEPWHMRWFMRENPETGEWDIPVLGAKKVYLLPLGRSGQVWAEGVEDMPEPRASKYRRASKQARRSLVRLASTLPTGSNERLAILSCLKGVE
jgi:hypothetical protein